MVCFGGRNALPDFCLANQAHDAVGAVRILAVQAVIVHAVDERVEHGSKRRIASDFEFRLAAVRIDAFHTKALRDADSPHHIGLGEVYQVLGKLALHDFFVMVHEDNGDIVNQVLDGLSADAAEEIAEVAPVLFIFLVDVHFGATKVDKHVAHVGKRKDPEFDGVFHVEDGIADIVGGFHQVHERMAHPLAAVDLREPERLGGNAVEVRFCRKQARRATVLGDLRVLHHRADGRVRKAHSAIKEVVFQLAQDAVPLGVAVKVFKVRNFFFVQVAKRCAGAVLAEPFADGGLPRMAERRVTDIVSEARRLHDGTELVFVDVLGQILLYQVEYGNRKASAHARDFDAVRESAMHVVVYLEGMYLSLAAQAAKSGRKDNAVVIAMVIGAVRVAIGRMAVSRRRQKSFPVEHAVNIAKKELGYVALFFFVLDATDD